MSENGLYHYNDSGYKVDLSKQQEQLYNEAFDPANHDEYLVNGAILTCSKAVFDVKVLHGKVYNVKKPSKVTVLEVTENPQAKCCGYLYHATVEDRKVKINIPPFRCNCSREPHNDKEWAKLEADESCMEEGTCKALINLNDKWDNLPAENPYLLFWNEDRHGMVQGITMSSMLFCRHGGIITPIVSGQIDDAYLFEPDINDPDQVERYMWYFFLNKGLSYTVVAGILGNVKAESKFDLPWAENYNPNRFGLFQWSRSENDGRAQEFTKWLNENGLNRDLISTQCEYAYHEMTTNKGAYILDANDNNPSDLLCSYDTLLNAQTPEEAARIFATFFEGCFISYYINKEDDMVHYSDIQHSSDRQTNASDVYTEMMNEMCK